MILWTVIFAGILVWRGFSLKNKKTLAIYAGVGSVGLILMVLYGFRILPRLAEVLTGY